MTTKIEWTERTWNVATGCDRTSPGCDNCYALTMARRLKAMGRAKYQRDGDPRTSGPGFGLTVHPDVLDEPLRRRKPTTYFVNSMSDLFHKDVPYEFIAEVFAVMALTPQHTYQVLTKRAQRLPNLLKDRPGESLPAAVERAIGRRFKDAPYADDGYDYLIPGVWDENGLEWPLSNVWLGTSIELDRYCFRADHLRATPAAVRFLSLEPLLGPLPSLDLTGIDWVIVGGESGPGARPMHGAWVRDIQDRCAETGTAFFFKQWGAHRTQLHHDEPDREPTAYVNVADGRTATEDEALADGGSWTAYYRFGTKGAGRILDGRTWDEMPERPAGTAA